MAKTAAAKTSKPAFDVKQAVTDRIISIMEKGVSEWRKTWATAGVSGFPKNGTTGAFYNGVNILILWSEAVEKGYTSNTWMTYKQAEAIGANVRKGEKGTLCVYFEMVKKKGEDNAAPVKDGENPGFFPMCKAFWVFNVAQIENLPEKFTVPTVAPVATFEPIEEAERILKASGAVITHGGDRAAFAPGLDLIRMPKPEQFDTPANYYATALHELTHWTGAQSRCNRQFGKRFGDAAYAAEELVAELGSAYLIGSCGLIESTIENHAAYLDHWLTVLKADKTAIFTAAKHATAAYDFIMARANPAEQAPAN